MFIKIHIISNNMVIVGRVQFFAPKIIKFSVQNTQTGCYYTLVGSGKCHCERKRGSPANPSDFMRSKSVELKCSECPLSVTKMSTNLYSKSRVDFSQPKYICLLYVQYK